LTHPVYSGELGNSHLKLEKLFRRGMMKRSISLLVLTFVSLAWATQGLCNNAPAPAAAAATTPAAKAPAAKRPPKPSVPQKLLDINCVGCHKEEAYSAQARKVTSLKGLKEKVSACAAAAKINWSEKQKDKVTGYLDKTYYKFK
jgi:cytochrome c553